MSPRPNAPRQAATHLYHTLFTGLILTVVTRKGAQEAARWLKTVFRHQHHEKFLASFEKLGLSDKPDAVAAAAYHYLSNRIGGVDVEFMRESDTKAWVRFPPPRWVYPGAAICGIPSEVSRAMLTGWYAQNGVSLKNPRLGFVCTGQTVDCQDGLAGYFLEYDHDLDEIDRLVFRPGETPPIFDPDKAPILPEAEWPPERLAKARRNYAIEYLRSSLPRLFEVFGLSEGLHLGRTACWLIGAQLARETAGSLGITARDASSFADLMIALAQGEGDRATAETVEICNSGGSSVIVSRQSVRPLSGLGLQPPQLFEAWNAILEGVAAGHNRALRLEVIERPDLGRSYGQAPKTYRWRITERN